MTYLRVCTKNNKGSALIVALIILVILTLAGIAGVMISRGNMSGSRRDRLHNMLDNLAESGVLRAHKKIHKYFTETPMSTTTPTVTFHDPAKKESDETFHMDTSNPKAEYFEFKRKLGNKTYRIRYRIDGGIIWRCHLDSNFGVRICQCDFEIQAGVLDPRRDADKSLPASAKKAPYFDSLMRSVYSVRLVDAARLGAIFVDDLEVGDSTSPFAPEFSFAGIVHTNRSFFIGGGKNKIFLDGYLSAAGYIAAFPLTKDYSSLTASDFSKLGLTNRKWDGSSPKELTPNKDAVEVKSPSSFKAEHLNEENRHDGQPSPPDTWKVDDDWPRYSMDPSVFDGRLRDSATGIGEINMDGSINPYDSGNPFISNADILVTLKQPSGASQELDVVHAPTGLTATFDCPASGSGKCKLTSLNGSHVVFAGGFDPDKIFYKKMFYDGRESRDINALSLDMSELVALTHTVQVKIRVGGEIFDTSSLESVLIYSTFEKPAGTDVDDCNVRKYRCQEDPSLPECSNPNTCDASKAWISPDPSRSNYALMIQDAAVLPKSVMIATDRPLYVWGDFNLHQTSSGRYDPYSTKAIKAGDTWRPAALVADSITVLSNNFDPTAPPNKAGQSQAQHDIVGHNNAPAGTDIEVNATIVAGWTPPLPEEADGYNGGWENYVRLLEDFNSGGTRYKLVINGNFLQLWRSRYNTARYAAPHNYYTAPERDWRYEWAYRNCDSDSCFPPKFKTIFGAIVPPAIIGGFKNQFIVKIGREQTDLNLKIE